MMVLLADIVSPRVIFVQIVIVQHSISAYSLSRGCWCTGAR